MSFDKPLMTWRPVAVNPAYEITEYGHVRRRLPAGNGRVGFLVKPQRVMNTHRGKDGYGWHLSVGLQMRFGGRSGKRFLIHDLVARTFLGPRPARGMVVRHLDGNPTNNHVSNLKYGTQLENMRDAAEHARACVPISRMQPTYVPPPPPPVVHPPSRTSLGQFKGVEWRTMPDTEFRAISDDGQMMCLGTNYDPADGVLMRGNVDYKGYLIFAVHYADGKYGLRRAHRLVALTFIGPPEPHQNLVRHLDDDRANNHVSNLACGDDSDNVQDAKRNGLRGSLTPEQVHLIRTSKKTSKVLAKELGTTTAAVSFARMGRTYAEHPTPRRPKLERNETGRKLTEAQAIAALRDPRPASAVAEEFGVSFGTINCLRRRETWGHLPRETLPVWEAKREGEANGVSILTKAQARAALLDPRTAKAVAREIGVTASCIHQLRRGKSWAYLPEQKLQPERRQPRGEERTQAIMTEEKVIDLRRRFQAGESSVDLARRFGVGTGAVKSITQGKTWKHVPMPASGLVRPRARQECIAIEVEGVRYRSVDALARAYEIPKANVHAWRPRGLAGHYPRRAPIGARHPL